jgi:D-3-phosphoglycerate dehydrogenase
MYKIKMLNKIATVGTRQFDRNNYEVSTTVEEPDAILVRSANMLDMVFSSNLKAIARAGAGVNNIPLERCSQQGIVVFNTPGANANAVRELAIAALLLTSRDLVGGINWVRSRAGSGVDLAKKSKTARKRLSVRKFTVKNWVFSGWGPLARWLPTQLMILAWMFTVMIPILRSIMPGC